MDDRRFDAFIRTLGSGSSRRTVLRGLLGLGVGAATALVANERASAARRGFAGPTFPTPAPTPTPPPCAQIGDACGAGCCSGNCCAGTCLVEGACCTDADCPAGGDYTISTCSADHVCEISDDASCGPDCSMCNFAAFCDCFPLCLTGSLDEMAVCLEALCRPYLDGCPEACAGENPCAGEL